MITWVTTLRGNAVKQNFVLAIWLSLKTLCVMCCCRLGLNDGGLAVILEGYVMLCKSGWFNRSIYKVVYCFLNKDRNRTKAASGGLV